MVESIHRLLGIQSRDGGKLLQLGPVFLLTGLAYVAGVMAVQSLFVSRFGVDYLPLMYLLEAVVLPLQLWLFSFLSQRLAKGTLLKVFYLIIWLGVLACALFTFSMYWFRFQWRMFYPLLFIIVNVLLRILVPLMWTLGEGICMLQQAKRIFPILGALFTLGAILAGLLGRILPVYFQGCATELLILLVPVVLFFSLFLWRRLIAGYFLAEDFEDHNGRGASMSTVIKSVWFSKFLRIALLGFVLLLSLFYVVDFEFFLFMAVKYPGSDAMTQYFGMYVAVLYAVSFLAGLVMNRLIHGMGIGNTVFMMGAAACIVFIATGFMAYGPRALEGFFIGDLLIDLLSFTLLPPISQVFYKLLPVEQRAGASLLFAGSINAGGKLISAGITGLYSSRMAGLIFLSITGFLLAFAYLFLAWRQKHLYLSTLLGGLENHTVRAPELDDFSPGRLLGKGDVRPIVEALQSGNPVKESIALELSGHIRHEALFNALRPFLSHPDPQLRRLAFQSILQYQEAAEDTYLLALRDKEPEIRGAAIDRLKRTSKNDTRYKKWLVEMLDDSSPQVIAQAVMALYHYSDPALKNRLEAQIKAMLAGDDENRCQICRAVEDLHLKQYAPQIMSMLTPEFSSRVRIAAVECLGALGFPESIPLMMKLYPNADRELRQSIESSSIRMGDAAVPELSKCLDSHDIDIWHLGVAGLSCLDADDELAARLYQSCSLKLNGLCNIMSIPELLENEGFSDLAGLYRMRVAEDFDYIQEACWKVLSISIDPLIVSRLQEALTGKPGGDKREQAVEVLNELSHKHPLIADMLGVLYEDQPGPAEPARPAIRRLIESIPAFPDPWLNRFSSYAITRLEKGAI